MESRLLVARVRSTVVPVIWLLRQFSLLIHFLSCSTQLRPSLDAMRRVLESNDIPHIYEDIPGGRHNERAWSQRIDKPLLHLYGHGENKR